MAGATHQQDRKKRERATPRRVSTHPLHTSARSHSPALGRHSVPKNAGGPQRERGTTARKNIDGGNPPWLANELVGQVDEVPLHVSATSQPVSASSRHSKPAAGVCVSCQRDARWRGVASAATATVRARACASPRKLTCSKLTRRCITAVATCAFRFCKYVLAVARPRALAGAGVERARAARSAIGRLITACCCISIRAASSHTDSQNNDHTQHKEHRRRHCW